MSESHNSSEYKIPSGFIAHDTQSVENTFSLDKLRNPNVKNPTHDLILNISEEIDIVRSEYLESNWSANNKDNFSILSALKSIRKPSTIEHLVEKESRHGASLFKHLPYERQIKFFKEHNFTNSWIYYAKDNKDEVVLRYEILDDKVMAFGTETGVSGRLIENEELNNFTSSVQAYYCLVMGEIYKKEPKLILDIYNNPNSSKKVA